MAGYAVIADLQDLIAQFPISATSAPTTTQATTIINDTADEINARLSAAGLTTPVTTPASFLRALALLNAYGAAAAVLKSMFPDAVGPGDTPAYAFWEERYKAGLAAIANGSMSPADSVSNAGSILPSTYLTRNPDSEEALGDIAEPLFPVGKVY